MKQIKILFAIVVALCLSVGNVFAQAPDVKEMYLAVIWNPGTTNADAPFGWNVGGKGDDIPLKGKWDGEVWAPEYDDNVDDIAKAQVKFFLSALNPGLNGVKITDKTLDIEGIDFSGSEKNADYLGLPNVNIYSVYEVKSYDQIKADFDGAKPNAIVYIGAGAEIAEDKDKMFEVFRTAAKDNVGIFFIGQRSVTDARDLDPEKTTFPVMGVQKNFSIRQYGDGNYSEYGKGGDVVREFDFLTRNNDDEWDRADTVVLKGNDDAGYQMLLVEGGKITETIYDNKKGGWTAGDVVNPKPKILHKYGEWSINAKAVEVVEVDTYDAEMNYGFHREKDIWIGDVGGTVWMIKGSPSLFLNGKEILKTGTAHNLETTEIKTSDIIVPKLKYDKDKGEVTEDWILEAKNPESGKMDKFIVLRKGAKIETNPTQNPSGGDDWDGGSRIDMFNAGGLLDLRIALTNTKSSIHKDIFKHKDIKDVKELKFKPYGSGAGDNGRLQAAATIWAFNEKLDLTSFSELLDEGGFDPSKYYVDYLADQMAGKSTNTKAQFVRPQDSDGEFDKDGNTFRESELPAVSSSGSYQTNFSGKLYHQISVVQHGTQRLAMIGYQPTYLEDTDASRAILHDVTQWIGYDKYTLPTPRIFWEDKDGNRHEVSNGNVPTDANAVIVVFDRGQMTEDMKSKTHELFADLEYGDKKISANEKIDAGGKGNVEIRFDLQNDNEKGIKIDETRTDPDWIKVFVKSKVEPAPKTPFGGSEKDATINLKNLDANVQICSDGGECEDSKESTNSLDTLVVNITDSEDGSCPDDPKEVIVTVNGVPTPAIIVDCKVKIPFADQPAGDLDIKIVAKKPGYVDSEEKQVKVNNNPDKSAPVITKAMYRFGKYKNKSTGEKYPDTLRITFDEPALYDEAKEDILQLWGSTGSYSVNVRFIQNLTGENGELFFEFEIIKIDREPAEGDSININSDLTRDESNVYQGDTTGIIHDKYNNYALTGNKKVKLELGNKDVDVSIWVVIGNDSDKKQIINVIKPITRNPVVQNVLDDPDNGSVTIIDPNLNLTADGIKMIYAVILDVVGNKVVEYSYQDGIESGNKESFGTVIANMGGSKNYLIATWDYKNSAGRDVGAGSYVLLVKSQWTGNNTVFEHQKSIPVPARMKK